MKKQFWTIFFMVTLFFTLQIKVMAFLSDKSGTALDAESGAVNVTISHLVIGEGQFSFYQVLPTFELDSARPFSFRLTNNASNMVSYNLSLEMTWGDSLPLAGKLYLYPGSMEEAAIISDINLNNSLNALIGANVDDDKIIELPEGSGRGIQEELASAILPGETAHVFNYQLYFHGDSEILSNINLFDNKRLSINLVLTADVPARETAWRQELKETFALASSINKSLPVISEVILSNVFHVSQGSQINLRDYVVADDPLEGDLTENVTFTSQPTFNPNQPGRYLITYQVSNSQGIPAMPLTLPITIWDFASMSAGQDHVLALTSHGKVYAWGVNTYGQLGIGTYNITNIPTLITTLNNIKQIAAGHSSSYALSETGHLYSWGNNDIGQLGIGNAVTRANLPTLVEFPEPVSISKIAAKVHTVGALTDSNHLYTWGAGQYGILGDGQTANRFLPGLTSLTNIQEIAFGQNNGAALDLHGKLYTWGSNGQGQLGNPALYASANLPALVPYFEQNGIRLRSLALGWVHGGAIDENNRLYTWGYGAEGRLGTGSESSQKTPVPVAENVREIVAGYAHTALIDLNNQVLFCGFNSTGQHGSNDYTDHHSPYLIAQYQQVTAVALTYKASLIVSNGTIYGSGGNTYGSLGTGNYQATTTFTPFLFTVPSPERH